MHITKRVSSLLAAAVVIISVAAFAIMPAASAATLTRPATHAAAGSVKERTAPKVIEAPSGCNSNNFCSYNAGNGGSLCFQTSSDRSSWPGACAGHNDGAYNRNGNSVNLYWGYNYSDAYYTLYSGNYLLYMSKNKFNECVGGGTHCAGYNDTMQNQVVSSAFNAG
jgi:hypothetical protein